MTNWAEKYAAMHIKQLLNARDWLIQERSMKLYLYENCDKFADEVADIELQQQALYAELSTREHVPNKAEAKAIRQAKQKAKQNR